VSNYLLFISHSGADTWVARQLSNAGRSVGADIFLDEAEIAIGADFEADILASLNRASELLVLITPWALERPYVWMEIGAAWSRQIPIVVILNGISASDFQERARIPVLLKKRNLIDINSADRYFAELETRVSAHLSS
jgi:TIR domain